MCSVLCSSITTGVGCVLVLASCLISFLLVPFIVDKVIINQVVLEDDTIQYERFEEIPFPFEFNVNIMEISNPDEVLAGEAPVMNQLGPYVYKLYITRNISKQEDDILTYRRLERFEFDAEASFPFTEEDLVTVTNVPFHAISQIAEMLFPQLLPTLNLAMSSVFGPYNSPIMTVKVRDLLFDGVPICVRPGLVGGVACSIIRDIGQNVQNLVQQEDGSLLFSLLDYKNNKPSREYTAYRGLGNHLELGDVLTIEELPHFLFWVDASENDPGMCNMIKGTDSGIFAPFIDREKSLYAISMDICRSVELRYQYDSEVDGIETVLYSANEWFLDNSEGCFCLNTTVGITREDGCLLEGAMELYTCVGAMMVLSYPHFLYADMRYRNGVIGMTPNEDKHRITVELEPRTGTPVRASTRAQFNIFQRPVSGIAATSSLRTVLTPLFWVDEAVVLPEELKDELRQRLLLPLRILDIVIPVLISVCCVVLLIGVVLLVRAKSISRQPLVGEVRAK